MIVEKREIIRRELELGTGASIRAVASRGGLRSGLKIGFGDLDDRHGPVAELVPYGLKGHLVKLSFGSFSRDVIEQIKKADQEDVQLARALVASIGGDVEVDIPGQNMASWEVLDGSFRITAKVRGLDSPHDDSAIVATCRNVIVPMMAAMAELIGYDLLAEEVLDATPAFEGAVSRSVVNRRERNPRNRLLCIRIHGEKCFACGLEPRRFYADAGSIIEVHHLEPLSLQERIRLYDPRLDLVPLCPNCHRAVHTRSPVPLSIEELKGFMNVAVD
ncbi:HNH endonuclease [Alcanivorax sp. 1008]|uniref:HNH endonuclease n=1 Tax=Alcanivorax sp. 1008 TaxID=2816853 RepID=UPI001D906933|nr:HNH endonuclease [Alcanivorax sp. 1008]MCC1498290.1 HNH endonuclease [Alcanivorax sp. 1008]